ncbi:hypothetical protein AMECASPLE_014825 [Ameca splendens]|uniref:Uncharacterized protein n=1 Tax=Ameca splendens TaxID=208324 RepID=A0ABV0Y1K2_9TELE
MLEPRRRIRAERRRSLRALSHNKPVALLSNTQLISLQERGRDWCLQRPLGEAPGKTETTRRFFYEINQRFG